MKRHLERLDWRTRNRFLLIGALFLGMVSYRLGIQPTLAMRTAYHQQLASEAMSMGALRELERLRAAAKSAGQALSGTGGYDQLADTLRSEPERVAQYASNHSVQVRDMPVPEVFKVDDLRMEYAQYVLEGNYIALVRLLHEIEAAGDIRVTTVHFIKKRHPVNRLPVLHMQLGTARFSKKTVDYE